MSLGGEWRVDAPPAVVAAGRSAFPGFTLRLLARTPSTQDVVRAAARSGAAAGFCCVAGEQSAGRGRQGRSWEAPAGSALLMSLLLRPDPAVAPLVPLAAGVATAQAVQERAGVAVRLKWPNDVLVGGAKLAGILAEAEMGSGTPAVVLGIGLNLAVDHFPVGAVGTSLHRLVSPAAPPAWDEMLAALLRALGRWSRSLETDGGAAVLTAWRELAAGLGTTVRAVTPAGEVRGVAVDVDADGALLLDTPGGRVRVLAGDVHLGEPAS